MEPLTLRHVAVGWDEASQPGLLAPAVEWAERLGLPVHLQAPAGAHPGRFRGDPVGSLPAVCERQRVPWVLDTGPAYPAGCLGVHARQAPKAPASPAGQEPSARLYAPPLWRPLERVLVMHQADLPDPGWLASAAALCRSLRVAPVILVVAAAEAKAERTRRAVEAELGRQRLTADVDLAVGCDPATAANLAVRWRRCTHVIAARPGLARRPQALNLPEEVALLAWPAGGLIVPERQPTGLAGFPR
jgi:hypothetical protein